MYSVYIVDDEELMVDDQVKACEIVFNLIKLKEEQSAENVSALLLQFIRRT